MPVKKKILVPAKFHYHTNVPLGVCDRNTEIVSSSTKNRGPADSETLNIPYSPCFPYLYTWHAFEGSHDYLAVDGEKKSGANTHPCLTPLFMSWKALKSFPILIVTLTKDLTWGKHIDIIRAKANQQLAFVRRNIRTRSSSTKEKLFNTLVRPHLEYAATVWDPHIYKQKHSLELVQRRAARWVTNRHHNTSSVTDMLHTLGWTSLEHRRATSRLCMLYQIYHGSIGIPQDPYILPYRHTPRPSRQTDIHTLATYQCRTNYFKRSFFPQTIVAWNALTKCVVTSSTLDAFKAALPLGRPIPCYRF